MENLESYIEINPKKMMGKPVIKGTQITAELILEGLASGRSIECLLASYTSLIREVMLAALQFAANNLRADYVCPIAS